MKFQVGDKVALNKQWVQWGSMYRGYHAGREALVIGSSRTPQCVRVAFKGLKTPQTFHESFFDLKAAATHRTVRYAKELKK